MVTYVTDDVTWPWKVKVVTRIHLAQFLENGWRRYTTIANYLIVCCEAVRSAILVTAWLLVLCNCTGKIQYFTSNSIANLLLHATQIPGGAYTLSPSIIYSCRSRGGEYADHPNTPVTEKPPDACTSVERFFSDIWAFLYECMSTLRLRSIRLTWLIRRLWH